MKKLRYVTLFITLLAVITYTFLPPTAHAVTKADWNAGHIVDDFMFTNYKDMSVSDIQNFLNKLVPTCDTNGTQPATEYGRPDLTHAQYATARGWAGPPYVCLKDYYEVPKYTPGDYIPDNNFSGSVPAGAVSAAQIIYDAAKLNNISPKAILVKIGTESAGPLTSDNWPMQSQYTYAMGSHCPDSGPGGSANCDRNYAGFSMQVSSGAGLLRWYLDNMNQPWWTYKRPFQTNDVLWNVKETGCGSASIYIESMATAALYTYTPYQPNQAALNNLYGRGDSCSAYGNRNFWRVWNDWFGPTTDRNAIFRNYENGIMYLKGDNATLYRIGNGDQLSDLGYGRGLLASYTSVNSSVINSYSIQDMPPLIRFGTMPEVYVYSNNLLHYVNAGTYSLYGSPAIAQVPAYLKNQYVMSTDASSAIRDPKTGAVYLVDAAKKRFVVDKPAYDYYGVSTASLYDTSSSLLSGLPDSYPLLAPGTTVTATDTNTSYIITDALQRQPLDPTILKSLTLSRPPYGAVSGALSTYPVNASAQTAGFFVQDSSTNLYLLNAAFKINLSPTQFTQLGKPLNAYAPVDDSFLSQFTKKTIPGDLLIRTDNDPCVYLVNNNEIILFQSGADFGALNYSFDNVLSLKANTVNNIFTNKHRSIILPGMLIKTSSSPSVYLVDSSNVIHLVPTGTMFTSFGFSWSAIRVVSDSTVSLATSGTVLQPVIKTSTDGAYWLITNKTRRWIANSLQSTYALQQTDPVGVPLSIISNQIPSSNATSFIKTSDNADVYYIESGVKHVVSSNALFALGGSWSMVVVVEPYIINYFTTGSPIY